MLCPSEGTTPDVSGVVCQPLEVLPSADNGTLGGNDTFRQVNSTRVYRVSKDKVNEFRQFKDGALTGGAASGSICGWDTTNLGGAIDDYTDLIGLQEHTVRKIPIVHAAFVYEAQGVRRVLCHIPQSA